MTAAKDAREWAPHALRGIGDWLYTPFCGDDGDDIDWDAYRTLVRYCVADLGHEMRWCTNGLSEFWALTLDELTRLLDVAIAEARAANPDVVIQSCTSSMSAKDCGVPPRDAAATVVHRVPEPDLGREADRGDGLRAGVGAGPIQPRHGLLVHLLPGPPGRRLRAPRTARRLTRSDLRKTLPIDVQYVHTSS